MVMKMTHAGEGSGAYPTVAEIMPRVPSEKKQGGVSDSDSV